MPAFRGLESGLTALNALLQVTPTPYAQGIIAVSLTIVNVWILFASESIEIDVCV